MRWLKVQEVSRLTGVSVRTLHHYDAIGLLHPDDVTEAGYRLYSNENLATLQQILFFRELGFSLKKIQALLDSPSFDRQEAFVMQRKMLIEKRKKLDEMIDTIDLTIQQEKGAYTMTNEARFKGFDFSKGKEYEQEARARWGEAAVNDANEQLRDGVFEDEMNRIYFKLAELRNEHPSSSEAQEVIGEWYKLLNKMGNYSLEAFAGLGQMYVADERFMNNIDQFGEGLAQFMCEAMTVYARNSK